MSKVDIKLRNFVRMTTFLAMTLLCLLSRGQSAKCFEMKPRFFGLHMQEKTFYSRGNFRFKETYLAEPSKLSKQAKKIQEGSHVYVIEGSLEGACQNKIKFTLLRESSSKYSFHLIKHSIRNATDCLKLQIRFAKDPGERVMGLGTQATHFDLTGQKVHVISQEQGHGRGKQPVTAFANQIGGAGGTSVSSYAVVPHILTTSGQSLFLESSDITVFDLRNPKYIAIEFNSNELRGQIHLNDDPKELIASYTQVHGRMPHLPDWVHSGPIVEIGGGEDVARQQVRTLQRVGIPSPTLWIQDWTGRRQGLFWKRLWWNWEPDRDLYPNWPRFIRELKSKGFQILSYINPRLSPVKDAKANHQNAYYQIAKERGYLVKGPKGRPIHVASGGFSGGLIDLTNPAARKWFKALITQQFIIPGIDGWMADFGEGLPFHAKLHTGISAKKYHNLYVNEWSVLNREVIQESKRSDIIFFVRSGYLKTPKYASFFWLGDQMTTWDKFDGLASTISGLVSSGLSGHAFNHSDVGGMIAMPIRGFRQFRTKELMLRWLETNAFTPILRTHFGTNPSLNYQIYTDDQGLKSFKKFSLIYKGLFNYRKHLLAQAYNKGLPLIRHPYLHYPKIDEVFNTENQFMLGNQFLIAPVVKPGQTSRKLFLPPGNWIHLWSQKNFLSKSGQWITIDAPIGEPPVFYLSDSPYGKKLFKFVLENIETSARNLTESGRSL